SNPTTPTCSGSCFSRRRRRYQTACASRAPALQHSPNRIGRSMGLKPLTKPGAGLQSVRTTNLDPALRVRALSFSRLVAKARNYLALTKPRVTSLVVFTAVVTLVLAPGHVAPIVGVATIVCITIGAGAAGALNMWYDADVDALMTRTAARPIPVGRVSAE